MANKKNQPTTLRERIETSLRGVCGRVSPDSRAAVIIAMLVLFTVLNIRLMARAIWSIERGDNPPQQIEKLLKTHDNDTTNIEQQQGQR